jgi:hypothetical protein
VRDRARRTALAAARGESRLSRRPLGWQSAAVADFVELFVVNDGG